MANKNLGLVQAMHSGLTPPTNIKMLWYDENVNFLKYYSAGNEEWELLKSTLQGSNIGVTVGLEGDYDTINEALVVLSKLTPEYKKGGVTATITLLEGFVWAEQIIVKNIDLSWITIFSEATIINVTGEALTEEFTNMTPAIYGNNAGIPNISCNLTMNGDNEKGVGILLENNSKGLCIAYATSFYDFYNRGIAVISSRFTGIGVRVDSSFIGVLADEASTVTISKGVIYNCNIGVYANYGSIISIVSGEFNLCITDGSVRRGGLLMASNTGTYQVWGQTPNILTGDGIIFN